MALWLVTAANPSGNPGLTGGLAGAIARRIDDRPFPTVQAHGIAGVAIHQCYIEEADADPTAGLTAKQVRAIANHVHGKDG